MVAMSAKKSSCAMSRRRFRKSMRVVPIDDAAHKKIKLLRQGMLTTYLGRTACARPTPMQSILAGVRPGRSEQSQQANRRGREMMIERPPTAFD
jgi:hypothetical protein